MYRMAKPAMKGAETRHQVWCLSQMHHTVNPHLSWVNLKHLAGISMVFLIIFTVVYFYFLYFWPHKRSSFHTKTHVLIKSSWYLSCVSKWHCMAAIAAWSDSVRSGRCSIMFQVYCSYCTLLPAWAKELNRSPWPENWLTWRKLN